MFKCGRFCGADFLSFSEALKNQARDGWKYLKTFS
jgi:hypothetical protein